MTETVELIVTCSLCGVQVNGHRGQLSAVAASRWGVHTERLTLCEAHMLVALDAIARHAWAYGFEQPRGAFDLTAWAKPGQLTHCSLCGRGFLLDTSGVMRAPIKGWPPLYACEPCSCEPFSALCERAQRTANAAQRRGVELTYEGLLAHLRARGKMAWQS